MTSGTEELANELERWMYRNPQWNSGDLFDRILTALRHREAATAEALEALEPFAREADRWTHHTPDETPLVGEPITQEGWEYRFTVGDLRRAAAILTKAKGGVG